MNVLKPLTITAAMIGAATTVAEPAAGETEWGSGGTYALGGLCIRAATHRVYACVQPHTGRAVLPEVDSAYWLDKSPTQLWAPFDIYTSTAALGATSMTYVLQPGFFNALALYGLTGAAISITIKDAPGGAVIYSYTGDLSVPPGGWYEYLFTPNVPVPKLFLKDLPIRPTAELTITVTGASVGIGMINVGNYTSLLGSGNWGGTRYGASAEPISYSYIKINPDGSTAIVRRTNATGMRATVMLPRDQADAGLATLQDVLDVPVSWVATDTQGYAGLNVFGLGSASVSYDNHVTASININVKGMI